MAVDQAERESVSEQVRRIEEQANHHRRQFIKSEQKFDRVVGLLLAGEKVCIRCWQPETRHVPGPPTPPLTKGHLGATEDQPGCCNDFLELTRERWEAGDGTGIATSSKGSGEGAE